MLPDGLTMEEGGSTSTFNKTVSVQSDQGDRTSRNVTVTRESDNSYIFNLDVQLDLGESVMLTVSWDLRAETAGTHNITLVVSSDDSDFDSRYATCQDTRAVEVIRDAPVMGEPLISPIYHQPDLDPQEIYAYPNQDITVRCNVTSDAGIENVSLFYSVNKGLSWNQIAMTWVSGDEYVGTVPRQSEGGKVWFYIETNSLTGRSSRTRDYTCTISNLQALDQGTKIAGIATATAILVGCATILARKRRKMRETL